MAKQYGLNVPKQIVKRPAIFEESDSEDCEQPSGLKKSIKTQDKIIQKKAIEQDPTVYQYDEVYDEIEQKRKESKLSRKDLDRKPKYINKLLEAADRRKKENERRIERQVQRERETEGNVFRDKESFVTNSYKKKLEELAEMEEMERREDYLEAIGDVTKQGNLDGFYRHLYDQKVNLVEESKNETLEIGNRNVENKSKITRMYRKHIGSESSDSEERSEVLKEHLTSNLDADSDFSIDSSDSESSIINSSINTEILENPKSMKVEQNEENVENTINEVIQNSSDVTLSVKESKGKIDIWKKRTVGDVFDEAVKRYYERKASEDL